MKISREIVMKAGIVPKLKLAIKTDKGVKGTGPHTVKMLEDKLINSIHRESGLKINKVRYYVEEAGEKKMYEAPLKMMVKDDNGKWSEGDVHYLVQHLSEVEEGEEITMEYKRAGVKGYIEVIRNGEISKLDDIDEEDDGSDNEGFMGVDEGKK